MKNKTKLLKIFALVLAAFAFVYLLIFIIRPSIGCVISGGSITIEEDCAASPQFSNTCNGYSACAPEYRSKKITCSCNQKECFNGYKCELRNIYKIFEGITYIKNILN